MTDDASLETLENERRYIARELHDGAAQTIQQLGLQVSICRKLLERGKVEMLNRELMELEQRVQLASEQTRDMISDLRSPQVEADAGLEEYIEYSIDVHRRRGGPPVEYSCQLTNEPPVLTPLQLLTLTRIVEEALLNARKHARAKKVRLTLSETPDRFYLAISDNGQGFDLAEAQDRSTDLGGAGLANLQARAQLIGGEITLKTGKEGTQVTLELPKR